MPTRTRLSEAEREQRRAADREFVQQAVEQLRSSDGWQRWLVTRRHFHAYSLLISMTGVIDPVSRGCRRRRHVAAAGRVPVSRRVPVLPASGRLSPMASIRTLGAQACEPLDVRTTRDVQSLRGQCPGGQKAASLTDAAPPLFGASGRRSVLSCGVVSSLVAVEVLVPVAPTLRFPLV